MRAEALIVRPIRHGWSVQLTGGRQLADFHGPGARIRAVRYLSRLTGASHQPTAVVTTSTV
jgi:hypothetical protein